MSKSNFLGGEQAATYPPGKDVEALGPSDSSDSGSDVQGEHTLRGVGENADLPGSLVVDSGNDSDASGTGERASATGRDSLDGADIAPDHVIGADGLSEDKLDGSVPLSSVLELLADDDDDDDIDIEPESPAF